MIKTKFVSLLAMLVVGMMIGNSFVVMAAMPPQETRPAVIVWAGNHDVSTTETYTNEEIYVAGNVRILNGGTLSLTNTTLQINQTHEGQFYIEVQSGGTLILNDGGDGLTANDPADTDPSVITTDAGLRTYLWSRAGSTFTATNSVIENIGHTGAAYLDGGTSPETDIGDWTAVTNGTFGITINGVTQNIWGCDFSGIDGAPSVGADVAAIVQAALIGAGYTGTIVTWTGTYFTMTAPNWVDGVFVRSSTISQLTAGAAGGTDISGVAASPGAFFLDMAANGTAVISTSSRTGAYFATPNTNIVGCNVNNGGNGLFFDCVFPASLAGTNITNNDLHGVVIANVTTQSWACGGVLDGFNSLYNPGKGLFVYAQTVNNLEVRNANISENGYGMTVLARTFAYANVHANNLWDNYESADTAGAFGSAIYVAALPGTGQTSITNADVYDNILVDNLCGGVFVGYEYQGQRSNRTNVNLNNNYLSGTVEGNVIHATDNIFFHAEGNHFTGDGSTNWADGLKVGTGKGVECMDSDQWTENVTLEVINNNFFYPVDDTYVEVGGVLRTGALWSMDATVTGNHVRGSYTQYGGIFLLGAPSGAIGGLDEFGRVRYLTAYVAYNTVEIFYEGSDASIGGIFIFNALENMDVQLLNNEVTSYQGGTGGLVELQGAVDEDAGLYFPVKNITALIQGNRFFFDPANSGGSGGAGGYIRVRGYLNVHVTIIENEFIYSDAGADADTGGVIKIGTYMWEYMPAQENLVVDISDNIFDLYNEDQDVGGIIRLTPFENMDVTITGNEISAMMNEALIGGVIWIGMQGSSLETDPTPSQCQNMTADVSGNTFVIHSFEIDGGSLDLGGILRMYAFNMIDAKFNDNKVSIDIFRSTSMGEGMNGFIWVGKHGETHTAKTLDFEMINNEISISLYNARLNGLVRLFAYERIDTTIEHNIVKVSSQYYSDNNIELGGFFTIGDWGNESAHSNTTDFIDTYERFDLETTVNFNDNNIQAWFSYSARSIGGMLRVTGREVTEVNMANNVMMGFRTPEANGQTEEDTVYDFGVRIGKHGFCTDQDACLISNHTTVTMSNNIIGPGGKGSELFIAGRNSLIVDIEDSTIQGALRDNWDDEYQTAYGNGVTLYGVTGMTATFKNVRFLDNRGAGLYALTYGTGTLNVYDSRFIGNDWGGIRTSTGYKTGSLSGTIANCTVYGSEDEFDAIDESTDGMHFEHSTFLVLNSTLDNPLADNEFNVTANSHVTARNTVFNKDAATVEATAAYLVTGEHTEYPSLHWNWWSENYWNGINNGAFNITIDGFAANVGPIDFTGASTRADVAGRIQAAIRAVPGAPDGFLNATVRFILDDIYGPGTTSMIITSGTVGATSSISKLRVYNGAGPFTDISGETVSSPAMLVGGPGVGTDWWEWDLITDGTFRITIDGYSADVGPIDFSSTNGNSGNICNAIQNAIRAVPAAPAGFTNAVCRLTYNFFWGGYTSIGIISGTTGQTSSVSYLTPHSMGTGTDISGYEVSPNGYWWLDGSSSYAMKHLADSWMDGSDNGTVYASTSSDLLVQWFLDVATIRLDNSMPIPGSAVTVRNLANAVVATGTTGADGVAHCLITSEYLQTPTTKTFYTPHTVTATKGNATGNAVPPPTMDTSKTVVIALNYVPPLPTADAGSDVAVLQGFNATFNGTGTADSALIYVWTFTNGTVNYTLNGNIVTFNCSGPAMLPGAYTVTLTVTDAWGQTANDTMVLRVIDPNPPVANAGPDQTVNEDTVVTFNGAGSFDVDNYTWALTDGGAVLMYGVAPTHTFAEPGVYLVTLTVTDIDGNTDIDTMTVTVLDITAPVADAGADATIPEGGTVHFVGTASTDNVGVVAYQWTFTEGDNIITLTGATANYTFMSVGLYDVTLTVYDAAGNSDTDHVLVSVTDATAPAVLVIAPGESLTDVPLDWSLVIVFTEPMNQTSVEEQFTITGFTGTVTFTWDATGTYVQVSFQGGLEYGTQYTITVGTNATDLSGNHLAAAKTSTFTTVAEPEPVPEPETNFFTDNWWILVVIIVVLAVLLLITMLKGKGEQPPVAAGAPPAPPAEEPPMEQPPAEEPPQEAAPEELPPEEP